VLFSISVVGILVTFAGDLFGLEGYTERGLVWIFFIQGIFWSTVFFVILCVVGYTNIFVEADKILTPVAAGICGFLLEFVYSGPSALKEFFSFDRELFAVANFFAGTISGLIASFAGVITDKVIRAIRG
jgi:hypothetical protein